MPQFAIRIRDFVRRHARAVGALLIILCLVAWGASYAGVAGTVFLVALAGISSVCVLVAHREHVGRREAEGAFDRYCTTCKDNSVPLAAELARLANRHTETLNQMLAGCQIIGFDWRYLFVNDAVARQGRVSKEEMVGRTMMECYPGIENTSLFPILRRCMDARTPEYVENEFMHNDGTPGWFELSIQPVPEGLFIISIDITERKRAELNMRRQLDRLHSLRAIDLAILSTTDLPFTLRTILEEARARLRVDGACIRFFNEPSLQLEFAASCGNAPAEGPPIHVSEPVRGRAARERRTIAVPDTAVSPDAVHLVKDIGAIYATPLIAKGRLTGVMAVTFDKPFEADHDWIDYFEMVAGQASMAIESGRMFDELQRSHLDLRLAYDTTIEGWSRALDLRDKETEGHTQRVTEWTEKLAHKAGLSEEEIMHIRRGALLHDIGKMGVPDQILLKPDKLTPDEWEIMRRHPTYAYELLRPIEYLRSALDIPFCHHEKWDGSGYPRGLKGEQIPLAARLFAVADVWDAIRSDRPYRSGWSEERALEYIRSQSGTHFDPRAVGLFVRLYQEEKDAARVREPVAVR